MRVAVIPARGGSKRIPRKNVRSFHGKPIIAYSIEAARQSGLFEAILVSTDDPEIARISNDLGAETPFVRPPQLSDDHTGTNAVVKHALQWLAEHGRAADYACCIYATAPFLTPHYLRIGFEKLSKSDRSFAFSVTSFSFAVQRALRINAAGALEARWPEHTFARSQDLEELYHDAGQFYWGRAAAFLNDTALYSPASLPVILPRYLVQDIDTLEDWGLAELMYSAASERGLLCG